jgi:hypothetical protein
LKTVSNRKPDTGWATAVLSATVDGNGEHTGGVGKRIEHIDRLFAGLESTPPVSSRC